MRAHQVDSEVGALRTVLLHRPGAELRRLTPRNNDQLLFDGIPWVGRAQEEHDAFAQALTDRGVGVLYVVPLLTEALALPDARTEAVDATLARIRLGEALGMYLHDYLHDLPAGELAETLVTGLAHDELPGGRGLAYTLMDRRDFVIDPLPNLLFTRDSSTWIGESVAVTSLAMGARRRETDLTRIIYRYHSRFAADGPAKGPDLLYEPDLEPLEGGDVLLLAPGVLAVGTGERTAPSGVERLAVRAFAGGIAHTVLAVPIAQERATMHLDTVCTMVDADAMLMYPNVADTLVAYTLTPDGDTPQVSGPAPFLEAAARALGVERLRVIDTGLDAVTAEREQWDDGNNTLAIGARICVAYERNVETNARLEAEGIEVIRIAGSELGSGRGGPRCMSCPVRRDPLPA